jgi:anti-sigma regulatory factor (Ser/Thr protein kinase)
LVSTWLSSVGCDRETVEDLVLAVNEAVSNVVDHAYLDGDAGAGLTVAAEVLTGSGAHRVAITVIASGRWRHPPTAPGNRGRGLQLMRALSETVELDRGTGGTTARITSNPICFFSAFE